MIIGIDHLALSCSNVAAASQELARSGFSTQFIEKDLPNHSAKKAFLMHYALKHDIAYCRREDGIALELTNHRGGFDGAAATTAYHAYFEAAPPDLVPIDGLKPNLAAVWNYLKNGRSVRPAQWSPFTTSFWYNSAHSSLHPLGVSSVALPVAQLSKSSVFWQSGLGFRQKSTRYLETGERWENLVFLSPFKRWALDFVLIETNAGQTRAMLDAPGFRCLALITTDLRADLKKMMKAGGTEATEPFNLLLNGKMLQVALLRGPSDEIVELIELKTSKT